MDDMGEWVNEVRLVGRVSAAPEERELPSGDTVASMRVVVPRSAPARPTKGSTGGRAGPTVDTLDVSCWSARTRQRARRLKSGDVVEVVGSLRRRFYRAGAATVSRYEVEASSISAVRGRTAAP
jgi:single-strand DNA-binding protein